MLFNVHVGISCLAPQPQFQVGGCSNEFPKVEFCYLNARLETHLFDVLSSDFQMDLV